MQTWLITGCSTGFGREFALAVLARGWHAAVTARNPADIADIVEDLAPDERQAVFQTLDHETAAEALEEVDPKVQKAIVESLDSERAAEIVEEMDPDAAADLFWD